MPDKIAGNTRTGTLELNDEIPLSQSERRLANELGYLVADKLWNDLASYSHEGQIHNMGQTNYQAGSDALNLVSVYEEAGFYTLHKVLVAVDGVRRHMESLEVVSRTAFDHLLSAFIVNYISYGCILSGRQVKVFVPQDLTTVADLLVNNGFAQRHEDGIEWTDKIGPVMKQWGIWDQAGEYLNL